MKIRPKSISIIGWKILLALMIIVMLICLVFVHIQQEEKRWIFTVIVVIGEFFVVLESLYFWKIYLFLSDEFLYVPSDSRKDRKKIQFEEKILFDDIVSAQIIASRKNSKDRRIVGPALSGINYKKFIEFCLANGEKKRIYISYFSKKQILDVLNCIKAKDVNLNVDEIMKNWYYTYKEMKTKGIIVD